MNRRASATDVARVAGVSQKSVSRVINDDPHVSPELRRRVEEAIASLGYRPNIAARSLVLGRSKTIGMLALGTMDWGPATLTVGTERVIRAAGYSLLFATTVDDDPDTINKELGSLLDHGVAGIVINEPIGSPQLTRAVRDVPVLSQSGPYGVSSCEIVVDHAQADAARLAVEHLISSGRRRIAHITGPAHHAAAQHRARLTEDLLAQAGLELCGDRVQFGDWSEAWGRRAARAVLRTAPDTDAFFCGNDQIARGVADTLREEGRRVPDDIAVVGYDNWDTMALASRPPLTTIDMNLGEIGRVAALRLLEAIDGTATPGVRTVPCKLVMRESS